MDDVDPLRGFGFPIVDRMVAASSLRLDLAPVPVFGHRKLMFRVCVVWRGGFVIGSFEAGRPNLACANRMCRPRSAGRVSRTGSVDSGSRAWADGHVSDIHVGRELAPVNPVVSPLDATGALNTQTLDEHFAEEFSVESYHFSPPRPRFRRPRTAFSSSRVQAALHDGFSQRRLHV